MMDLKGLLLGTAKLAWEFNPFEASMGVMVMSDTHSLVPDDGTIAIGECFVPPPSKDYSRLIITNTEVYARLVKDGVSHWCISYSSEFELVI